MGMVDDEDTLDNGILDTDDDALVVENAVDVVDVVVGHLKRIVDGEKQGDPGWCWYSR